MDCGKAGMDNKKVKTITLNFISVLRYLQVNYGIFGKNGIFGSSLTLQSKCSSTTALEMVSLGGFCININQEHLGSIFGQLNDEKNTWFLKGQSHEIFDPQFFSSINTPGPPDSWVKAVSNINSYSRRYSIMKIDSALCCIARSRFIVWAIQKFFVLFCRQ
jgi:hypothetical protein